MIYMDNIRVIVALYEEYVFMWELMLPLFLAAANDQKNTSFEFQQIMSDLKNKMYASYLKASHDFFEMQETNPDWQKALTYDGVGKMPDYDFSCLVDELREIATVYSERKRFLDMLNYLAYAAKKEQHINPYFLTNIRLLQESMMNFCWNSLLEFHEKRSKLAHWGGCLEKYFDNELLHVMKDMDTLEYVCYESPYEEWDYS